MPTAVVTYRASQWSDHAFGRDQGQRARRRQATFRNRSATSQPECRRLAAPKAPHRLAGAVEANPDGDRPATTRHRPRPSEFRVASAAPLQVLGPGAVRVAVVAAGTCPKPFVGPGVRRHGFAVAESLPGVGYSVDPSPFAEVGVVAFMGAALEVRHPPWRHEQARRINDLAFDFVVGKGMRAMLPVKVADLAVRHNRTLDPDQNERRSGDCRRPRGWPNGS